MSYDAWKTRSPDDEYPEKECSHEDYEANSEGRATCCREERRQRIGALLHRLAFWRRWRRPSPITDAVPF